MPSLAANSNVINTEIGDFAFTLKTSGRGLDYDKREGWFWRGHAFGLGLGLLL